MYVAWCAHSVQRALTRSQLICPEGLWPRPILGFVKPKNVGISVVQCRFPASKIEYKLSPVGSTPRPEGPISGGKMERTEQGSHGSGSRGRSSRPSRSAVMNDPYSSYNMRAAKASRLVSLDSAFFYSAIRKREPRSSSCPLGRTIVGASVAAISGEVVLPPTVKAPSFAAVHFFVLLSDRSSVRSGGAAGIRIARCGARTLW